MTNPEKVTVEQCDRELFNFLLGLDVTEDTRRILAGDFDGHVKMQAIARHRQNSPEQFAENANCPRPAVGEEPVAWMYEIPDANVQQVYTGRRIWNDGWVETPLYARRT